jgi:putative Holliday junction resolvase
MRIMALDVGDKRIGVALSDALGITAQGLETLENTDATFVNIKQLCGRHQVSKIVVGLPRNMNGTYGPRAEYSREYALKLQEVVGLPIDFEDERLTTAAAERLMISADLSRKKRRQVVDKMAATLILQSYMQRSGKNV